ncbi:DMT family transporter [Fulvimarina sp. 2208YS6-2-32]|uniref:DMT family transporter n=1 Tax=Fulvimarina uroteuthidis TaxID=3098149 RepID=A0ABU5I4F5_9HYPH|nr:DMT family transporter [Fulvimarina sp. 2208YS6-2-32]MDY8110281.1 DMT family transporter [Fulvimarina sp. 2208YS6-2-32]
MSGKRGAFRLPAAGEALGVWLRVGSTFAFAVMGVCIKALGGSVPLGQIVFFRSAVALLPLVLFLWWSSGFPHGLATRRPFGHLWRSLLGACAMFTAFATIHLLPLAEATLLSYLAPVMLALLGWGLLGERLGMRRFGGILLGLCGGVAFCLPALSGTLSQGALPGFLLGLATAVLTAGALIQVRRLTLAGESAGAIAFWFAVVSAVTGLATLPFGWIVPGSREAALLLGSGLAGGIAHILMTLSFRHAEATALAPFEYLSILWAAAAGALFFAEVPDWAFFVALPLILAGSLVSLPKGQRVR